MNGYWRRNEVAMGGMFGVVVGMMQCKMNDCTYFIVTLFEHG